MSCYICDRKTFLTIVGGAIEYKLFTSTDEANEFFADLVNANYKSVNERYHENSEPSEEETTLTESELRSVYSRMENDSTIFDAIREFQYQSCESPDYYSEPGYYKTHWIKDRMLEKYLLKERKSAV